MKKSICILFSFLVLLIMPSLSSAQTYGKMFCSDPRFECIQIQRGQSWESLWPDPNQREVVKRLNRMNTPVYPGLIVAVPKDLHYLDVMDVAPFQPYITPPGEKTIIVDQKRLAWGAYTPNGELVNWGPISSGQNWCDDIDSTCKTATGKFYVYDKRGAACTSSKFPLGKGGAPMPYCMFFHQGFALHGSPVVPGYRASHGCVRIFHEDARWLSEEFTTGQGKTRIVVEPII